MPRAKDNHPQTGLYVTTRPLPGHEERVQAGRLVMFRHQSEQGVPLIQLPRTSENNRWLFHERGYLIRDPSYATTLSPRPPEGYYVANRMFHINDDSVIPRETLVQLSYSKYGNPILYVGTFEGNSIHFPEAGFKFAPDVLKYLDRAGFKAPAQHRERHLLN